MFEIELKAHVRNKSEVERLLATFAAYENTVEKYDVYWQFPSPNTSNNTITSNNFDTSNSIVKVRIREERISKSSTVESKTIVTYKKKEVRINEEGNSYEVNEENEFTISDRKPFELILKDVGFSIELCKQKTVQEWRYERALLELCTVKGLGEFLEIEILAENKDDETVTKARSELLSLLAKCEIPQSEIEKRYYSEMLLDIKNIK